MDSNQKDEPSRRRFLKTTAAGTAFLLTMNKAAAEAES